MKLRQDQRIGRNIITAYGTGFVEINGQRHSQGLILLPDRVVPSWGPTHISLLGIDDFSQLAAECGSDGIDVVLIGTGVRQHFPSLPLLQPLITGKIGVEIMDTHAACRTFNLLRGEERYVAAALLIDTE